jgi:hypothetical protein
MLMIYLFVYFAAYASVENFEPAFSPEHWY